VVVGVISTWFVAASIEDAIEPIGAAGLEWGTAEVLDPAPSNVEGLWWALHDATGEPAGEPTGLDEWVEVGEAAIAMVPRALVHALAALDPSGLVAVAQRWDGDELDAYDDDEVVVQLNRLASFARHVSTSDRVVCSLLFP
jgi:hypothetical protein